jgi:hypothetical protein
VSAAVGQLDVVAGLAAAAVADDEVGPQPPGQDVDRGALALVAEAEADGDDCLSHASSFDSQGTDRPRKTRKTRKRITTKRRRLRLLFFSGILLESLVVNRLRRKLAMSDADFRHWLSDEVAHGRMTPAQRDDLLEQKNYFDANRSEIEARHHLRVAGYVAGRLEAADTVQELFAKVQTTYPGKMVYFEPGGKRE